MKRALALAAAGMMAVTVPAVTFPSIASAQSYDPWSAPQEVIHPLCWSEDHLDGTRDGKEASQAGRDRREAAAS